MILYVYYILLLLLHDYDDSIVIEILFFKCNSGRDDY